MRSSFCWVFMVGLFLLFEEGRDGWLDGMKGLIVDFQANIPLFFLTVFAFWFWY